MRILFTSGHYNPQFASRELLLERAFTLRYFAQEQVRLGHQALVVMPFVRDESFELDGVSYALRQATPFWTGLGKLLGRAAGSFAYQYFQLATRLRTPMERFRPDIIHYFGLTVDLNLWLVLRWARIWRTPVVVHFNGGREARHPLRRAVQRQNLRNASRLLFTLSEQARPWIEAGLLDQPDKVVELLESSSFFQRRPRAEARRITGIGGSPSFLCAGRLSADKDPLTVLRGFAQVRREWPDARLTMVYLRADLLPEVTSLIQEEPLLRDAVDLRGQVPFGQMEAVYNSADFMLQASRREWSGLALLEAMACGVIPVVTDIPSFHKITAGGRFGRLFAPGDADALARQVLAFDPAPDALATVADDIHNHFQRELSFPALGRQLAAVYEDVLSGKRRNH